MMRYVRCAMWNCSFSRQPGSPGLQRWNTFLSLRQAVAKWKMFEASVDRRAQALYGPRRFERLQTRQQVAENRLQLDPGDVSAHAEVLADAEREMGIRAAIDAERERIPEHLLVAVRRCPEQGDLI